MGQAWFRTVRIALASLIAGLFAFTHASWSETIINSIQDLQNINNNLAGNYILGGDIDASGFNFTPVGCYGVCPNGFAFTGTLNGNGHTVNNLTIVTNSSYGGLFLGVSGAVRNIGLTNASVASKGFSAIGGIAGINSASIINSYVTGSINGVNAAAGGLVGVNDHSGVISEFYANVSVSGSGTGGGQDGGIAGNNYGTISESYATGAVIGSSPGIGSMVGGLVGYNAGSIRQSYSLASAAGANFNSVGGLVGENANTISEAYAAGRVQGGAGNSVGGLSGSHFSQCDRKQLLLGYPGDWLDHECRWNRPHHWCTPIRQPPYGVRSNGLGGDCRAISAVAMAGADKASFSCGVCARDMLRSDHVGYREEHSY